MDPLFDQGWIRFNELQWDLRSERVQLVPDKGNAWKLETVLYYNKKDRLVMPGRNSHLPAIFECSSTKNSGAIQYKRDAITKLAELVKEGKPKAGLTFSPVIDDVRPFQWAGFNVTPRYTFLLHLDDWQTQADKRLLRHIRKAKEQGYYCELTDDFDLLQRCLEFSEERKGFTHSVSTKNIKKLAEWMGDEKLLASICFSSDGTPVGARLTFCEPEGMAHAWSAGIQIGALRDGCNPLLFEFVANQLEQRGCNKIDLVGANIPGVAKAKASFGGELTTYYSVHRNTVRNIMKDGYMWLRSADRSVF